MEENRSQYEWLNNRFTPKVEAAIAKYLKENSNPDTETDFERGTISDLEREDYIRYFLTHLEAFWANPPGKDHKPKAKTPEEIEDFQIETIHELADDAIVQLERMGM